MSLKTPATVLIRSPSDWTGLSTRFIVRIDGRKVGSLSLLSPFGGISKTFTVEPGVHTVAVSTPWFWTRARARRLAVEAGSKTELIMRTRQESRPFLKQALGFIVAVIAGSAMSRLVGSVVPWAAGPAFLVFAALAFVAYVFVAPILVPEYWTFWELETKESRPVEVAP